MNLVQQADFAKNLSDQQLQRELMQPTGMIPSFLAMSEMKRRLDLRKSFPGDQGQQPQGSLAEEYSKGLMSMGAPNLQSAANMSEISGQPVPYGMGNVQALAPQQEAPGFADGGGIGYLRDLADDLSMPQGFADGGEVLRRKQRDWLSQFLPVQGGDIPSGEYTPLYLERLKELARSRGVPIPANLPQSQAPSWLEDAQSRIALEDPKAQLPNQRGGPTDTGTSGVRMPPDADVAPRRLPAAQDVLRSGMAYGDLANAVPVPEPPPSVGLGDFDPRYQPTPHDESQGVPNNVLPEQGAAPNARPTAATDRPAGLAGLRGGAGGGAGGAGGGGSAGTRYLGGDGLEDWVSRVRGLQAPDRYGEIEGRNRADRDRMIAGRESDKGLALLTAGLGIAAGESPNAITNIGRGAMAGVRQWNEIEKEYQRAERDLRTAENAITIARGNRDERQLEMATKLWGNAKMREEAAKDRAAAAAARGSDRAERRAERKEDREDAILLREIGVQTQIIKEARQSVKDVQSILDDPAKSAALPPARREALLNDVLEANEAAKEARGRLAELQGSYDKRKGREPTTDKPTGKPKIYGTFDPATGKIVTR